MNVAEYIVEELISYGVTDTFGVPGGVILRILYAMQSRTPKLTPHLNYHEQMSGFAACGYAQASGQLGVAYATRGPGITNMITCIAEAYQESLPVLFITAHNSSNLNQEMDLVESVSQFTKFAARADTVEEVFYILNQGCQKALEGRRGPVFLDFPTGILGKKIDLHRKVNLPVLQSFQPNISKFDEVIMLLQKKIGESERPIILIGDGLRQIKNRSLVYEMILSLGIPVLSSRVAQDIVSQCELYFGYIGSHGTRYSNFILSKTDLIIVIGNSLSFPLKSDSFSPILRNAQIIRLEIEEKEDLRVIPNSINYYINVEEFIEYLLQKLIRADSKSEWIKICNEIKYNLEDFDVTTPVKKLIQYLKQEKAEKIYVCDVGNNEFWFSRAFEKVRPAGAVLYSKSFGTLGVALGRAIGAYYATKKEIICIIGDQGFQYNIQELQYISYWKIPIKIIVLNNSCSEMILDHEKVIFDQKLIHVTQETGYSTPDFRNIAKGFNIKYIDEIEIKKYGIPSAPFIYEIHYKKECGLIPNLPTGNECQDMVPAIERTLYQYLNKL